METKKKYFDNPLYKHHNFTNGNIKYIDNPSHKNHNLIESNIDNYTLDDFYEGMNNDIEPPKNSICSYFLYYITFGFYRSSTEHYMEQPVNEDKCNQQKSDNNCRLI